MGEGVIQIGSMRQIKCLERIKSCDISGRAWLSRNEAGDVRSLRETSWTFVGDELRSRKLESRGVY